ncbi:hypothetical protein Tco_0191072 [Tanacetum coccineum]
MGLWYLKDSGFGLIVYLDADLAGCNDDYKSTSGSIQFLSHLDEDATNRLWISIQQDSNYSTWLNKSFQLLNSSLNFKALGDATTMIYAFTATVDVPVVYLQQFWKTCSKVPETKDTIKFKLDIQEITYIVDMFRDTSFTSGNSR